MTDADTIRNILTRHASFPFTNGDARTEAIAALDRLVAERDAETVRADLNERHALSLQEAIEAAEAEVEVRKRLYEASVKDRARLREVLREIATTHGDGLVANVLRVKAGAALAPSATGGDS